MSYVDSSDANQYFKFDNVNKDDWFEQPSDKRIAALRHATRIVNNLAFKGYKTQETQENEFPRNGETVVPEKVKYAVMEIAYVLATAKRDPQIDFEMIPIISQSKGAFKSKRDDKHSYVAIAHGVPSEVAWSYLKPYLVDIGTIRLKRV